MRILVANLGSTSFKFRLFNLNGREETMLIGAETIRPLQTDSMRSSRVTTR